MQTKIVSHAIKTSVISVLLLMSIHVAQAQIIFGIGAPYGPDVEYVPGHWERGYWVPGQYVGYDAPAGGVVIDYGYQDHWHHGYYDHYGYHHGYHNGYAHR